MQKNKTHHYERPSIYMLQDEKKDLRFFAEVMIDESKDGILIIPCTHKESVLLSCCSLLKQLQGLP